MTDAAHPGPADENKLIAERRAKLVALRTAGQAYPNDFRRDAHAGDLASAFGDKPTEWFDAHPTRVRVAGRMLAKRDMGKSSFANLQDSTGQIQLFLQASTLAGEYAAFKDWDVGDIIGAEGLLMRTRSGELSVRAEHLRLLVKALRPLPDKWHGLTDTEARYRQRYVDLIVNPASRAVFELRTRIVAYLRQFLDASGFMEVETPMMQPIPGGAVARPFVTHHNALDLDMYLRIAPELYLKRLVVGGFERVYEINRNFRNEGLSTRHNPEFTMLECYQAYADYRDFMDLVERMLKGLADSVLGTRVLDYQGAQIDLGSAFRRVTIEELLIEHNPGIDPMSLRDARYLRRVLDARGIAHAPADSPGKLQIDLFEETAEHALLQPTFVYAYPTDVSPLSRCNDADPFVTDRFEFFAAGRELANGFSELNDPEEQATRFRAQVARKDAGDAEAMYYDADYVRALEYGLPPSAGLGVGVDRLVMLCANVPSIRDVLLFPQLKPES
ncbi:MAG TPA: lysine--tRNA ligase [Steroidobacteraceae bacterium]|nr:lysine--tRNA ligase [Steroidobacteraceae bacterium]